MTREEAIIRIKGLYGNGYAEQEQALDMAIKALEQEPCDDAISRSDAIRVASGYCHWSNIPDELAKLPSVSTEKAGRWIPMTTRPMDDDEKEHFAEQLEYVDDAEIFNCPLPDDGQEVLITIYGETEIDTFLRDDVDGCYFENRDIEDVRAWMPLPQPYKGESEDAE